MTASAPRRPLRGRGSRLARVGAEWLCTACCLLPLVPGRAGAQVDPSGPWRTLHTAHFRIHFRPAYREAALAEAREAERAYGLLAGELHPPRGVVDLTLGDDIDAANGFTTVFPTPRITIFATPPAGDHGLLFYDSWLRLVTTHELTHVFHLDRARGIWSTVQHVLGRAPGSFPNEYQPSWVIEGLATYYESKFTNGGRVRGSFHTQLLAADHVAGVSRSPWDALLFTRWADGLVPYAYGSRFFHSVAGGAGDSVVPRFVEATSGQWIPFRVGRQLARAAPGRPLETEWARGTERAAGPGPGEGLQAAPPPERLDSLLRIEPVPRVSPDGRRLAYVWDDGKGASELRVLDAATFRPIASHRVNGGVDYDWVGDTLLVTQLDYTSRWRIRSDLYDWVPHGAWRRRTWGARLVAPAGSGGSSGRVATIALGAATAVPTVPVPDGPSGAVWTELAYAPDGRSVAGSRVANGRWSLLRWPADRAAAGAALVETRVSIADPVWTPRGELWFVADPTGFPQGYRWRDAGPPEPLTSDPLGARAPAPLSDGTLVYASPRARGWELRHAAPLTAGAPATLPDPLPFEAAPPVAARETGYTMWPSLVPHFWIPFFLNAGPSGRFGGAVTAGADAIGRVQYVADLFVAPERRRIAGDVTLVYQGLGNPTLDLSVSSRWLDLLPPPRVAGLIFSELYQQAALGASFVTQRWRGYASLRVAAELERTQFATIPDTSLAAVCAGCQTQDLLGGSVTLALSHLVTGALAVSPENGGTATLIYRRRQETATTRWSHELRGRVALYVRVPGLGGFAHHVLAVRLAAGGTGGPLGAVYSIGGVSAAPVGVSVGQSLGVTRTFPVRGYPNGTLSGRRAATGTLEYRLPLALIGRALGHLPVGADKLWLNAFADAGDAWAPGTSAQFTRLRSVGLELASRVALSYDFLFGVRLGIAQPLVAQPASAARRPQVYFTLGSDF